MAATTTAMATTQAAQDAAAYAEALKRSLAETLEGLGDDDEDTEDDDDGGGGVDGVGVGALANNQHHQPYAPLPPADELVAAVEAALAGGGGLAGQQVEDEEVAAAHACIRAALSGGGASSSTAAPRLPSSSSSAADARHPPRRQPRDYAAELDARRRAAELASVQDYVGESDALVRLHGRVRACDALLAESERALEAHERAVGACAGELRALQAQSAAMAGRLRGRREAEERLGRFIEHMAVPEELVRGIVGPSPLSAAAASAAAAAAAAAGINGSSSSSSSKDDPVVAAAAAAAVDEDLLEHLLALDAKLRFVDADEVAASSAARRDVGEVLARLEARAVSRARDWLAGKIASLRRPRTNVSIIQQSALLKFRLLPRFLARHAPEVLRDLKDEYASALGRVYSGRLRGYLSAMERLQVAAATLTDVLGVVPPEALAAAAAGAAAGGAAQDGGVAAAAAAAGAAGAALASATGALTGGVLSLFGGKPGGGAAAPGTGGGGHPIDLLERPFVLGSRAGALLQSDRPAAVPHAAEAAGARWPYEEVFRSVHKLLLDTATAEYLFCLDFWDDEALFARCLRPAARLVEEDLRAQVAAQGDCLGLLLMARLNAAHRRLMARRRASFLLEGYLDRVDLLLWPRFRLLCDLQVASLKQPGVEKALYAQAQAQAAAHAAAQAAAATSGARGRGGPSGGGGGGSAISISSSISSSSSASPAAHVHVVARRYAALASGLLLLVAGGLAEADGAFSPPQAFEEALRERLWGALFDALLRTSNLHATRRQGVVFLVANYAHVLRALREADAGPPVLTAGAPTAGGAPGGGAGQPPPPPPPQQQQQQEQRPTPNSQPAARLFASAAAAGMIGALGEMGAAAMRDVEAQLASCTGLYVDDVLAEHFGALVEFSKRAGQAAQRRAVAAAAAAASSHEAGEGGGTGGPAEEGAAAATVGGDPASAVLPGFGPAEAAPILRDFGARWAASIEAIHADTLRAFAGAGVGGGVVLTLLPAGGAGGCAGGAAAAAAAAGTGAAPALSAVATPPGAADAAVAREVLQAALTQLLLHYSRAVDLVRRQGSEGAALAREAVGVPAIMQRIRHLLGGGGGGGGWG